MPTIISVDELAEKTAKKMAEKMKPAPQPDSLNEPSGDTYNYKTKLAEMIRSSNPGAGWKWTGAPNKQASETKFFEAIGAVSAGSAIPEIWATDVFRCCPYPASAFWDAPFIKWHEDIHGKPGDTVHVITVGRAVCGTAGCAEPSSTAATIGACAITLEEYQCSHYICRNDLEDVVEDTITELNENLMTCLDTCIDNAFIANIMGLGSTLTKGTANITAAHIAEAIGTMRSGILVKRKILILRACIHEPVYLSCELSVNQEKQHVQSVDLNLSAHLVKDKRNVEIVVKKLLLTRKLINSGSKIGEKITLKKLNYIISLASKGTENYMQNLDGKEETNVTSVDSPIPDLNSTKSTGKNIPKIQFTTLATDSMTSFCSTLDAIKPHNGLSTNLVYPILNLKAE